VKNYVIMEIVLQRTSSTIKKGGYGTNDGRFFGNKSDLILTKIGKLLRVILNLHVLLPFLNGKDFDTSIKIYLNDRTVSPKFCHGLVLFNLRLFSL
jgi:hypothetical protein